VRPSEKQGSEGFLWHGLARYLTLRELCVCFWHFSDIDDLTACDGIKFWMSDGEHPVLCRVSHGALRDFAERVHFEGTYEKLFEAYRELIEQVAAMLTTLVRALMTLASFSSLRRRSPE
jgi:hypothetical protein